MPFETATTLETPTGARLRLYIQPARGTARGVVQINHGLTEHAGRHARFAAFLADRGFVTYAQDHRGHGHTKAPAAPLGSFGPEPAADNVIADVAAVHMRIEADHPKLPVVLCGHSLGAMIALVVLMRQAVRVDAAAIWNAPLAASLVARAAKVALAWERFRLGSDVPSRIAPRLTFAAWARATPDARTPFDWLTHDRQVVDDFLADPLCGFDPTVAMWSAVLDINREITAGEFSAVAKHTPIQLVGGEADPSTRGGRTVRRLETRFRKEGLTDVTTTIYPGSRHEPWNDRHRDRVMEDLARWLERVVERRTA